MSLVTSTTKENMMSDGGNGFLFDDGRGFVPAKLVDGQAKDNPDVYDDVASLIGDYGYCQSQANGLFSCYVWHDGKVVGIAQKPIAGRQ
jgi:hypothetical protein